VIVVVVFRRMNMRIATILTLAAMLTTQCLAESSEPLVGTWTMWNPRTVIQTGATDTVLVISGHPDAYRVSYTFGTVKTVKRSNGPLIYKTVTTTYRRIPLKKTGDIHSFVLPEDDKKIRFRLKDGVLELVLDNDNATHRPFTREKDNK
jgi:hypothetical protein